MDYPYWLRQEKSTPLFPNLEWSKPERHDQAGRLGIVGGNNFRFAAVADAYTATLKTGAGEARALLPSTLKTTIPLAMTKDILFAPTNPSGSLSTEAAAELKALGDWATGMLFIGDAGKNSQTAVLYEEFMVRYDRPLTITRDAIDLVQNSFARLVDNPNLTLVASFAQTQKIFRALYYPKVLTFSMQLSQFVEALHKFTITHPITIVSFHANQLVVAHNGRVATQAWSHPMSIWRGTVAARISTYMLWSPEQPLEAVMAAIVDDK